MEQIIAMGGGGFSMEPNNLVLDGYILEQTGKSRPAVCFLPTASGDADSYIVKFYSSFAQFTCVPSHLSLFRLPMADLRSFILEKDVIYVGGGNTRSLLSLWREWDLDEILREAWEQGVVLAGLSAGGMCWFEQGLTDSVPGQLGTLDCLGFLPGSFCPHYDGEVERSTAYHRLISAGNILPGYGVEDGAALHFVGTELKRVVSSRLNARAYVVAGDLDGAREQALETMCLVEG
ncbi:MAG: peptidase E [Anaerolineae bacterium]|nr:peptidase E [Anaerolineae bacterium]